MADLSLEASVEIFLKCNVTSEDIKSDLFASAVRTLRNFCATGISAQTCLANRLGLLSKTQEIIQMLLDKGENLTLLLCLQFLGNILVGHSENQRVVWQQFKTVLQRCLHYPNVKIQHCTTMIIYNILLNSAILNEINDSMVDIIELTQNEETSEYSTFILELLICKTQYISQHYRSLDTRCKLIILDLILSIHRDIGSRKYPIGMLRFLAEYYSSRADDILSSAHNDAQELDAFEVAKTLSTINTLTGADSESLEEIQSVHNLLIRSVAVLRDVHNISKSSGNSFSMLLKLADLENQAEEIQEHPAFGFKAALVRLIGNLCWKNKENQDMCREMGVIPLILDCCSIDARNPLIIQWAVLAMRNLCEDNIENQMVVASVDRRGQVDSNRLIELGMIFNGKNHNNVCDK